MGKMAIALGVDGIFMDVHHDPDNSLCDAPTQWHLGRLEWLLEFFNIKKKIDICFITCFIGPNIKFDLSHGFEKIKNAKYFLFTNLKEKEIKKYKPWKIININLDDFKYIGNAVKISRYFKFKSYEYLQKYCNINPKFIFYCDTYMHPKPEIKWKDVCKQLKRKDVGIIQYEHRRSKFGIDEDINQIKINNKETIENLNRTKEYLNQIDSKIDLKYPQYFENTMVGFYPSNNNCLKQIDEFWKYYLDCPTYRDQPLWNFIYLKNNFKPFICKDLKVYFKGKGTFKKFDRRIEDYKKADKIL